MKNKTLFWISGVILATVIATAAFGAMAFQRMDNSYFDAPRRPAAIFDHDAHNEQAELDDCALCHHVFDEEGNLSEFDSSEDQACGDCHGLKTVDRMPGLRKAYHLRCKGCHLTVQKGPIICADCHAGE